MKLNLSDKLTIIDEREKIFNKHANTVYWAICAILFVNFIVALFLNTEWTLSAWIRYALLIAGIIVVEVVFSISWHKARNDLGYFTRKFIEDKLKGENKDENITP